MLRKPRKGSGLVRFPRFGRYSQSGRYNARSGHSELCWLQAQSVCLRALGAFSGLARAERITEDPPAGWYGEKYTPGLA